MKVLPIIIVLVVSGALFDMGAQDPSTSNLEQRIADVEAQLTVERQRNEATEAMLHETLNYLARQADSANAMLGTLDQSEAEGFTAGINYRSREVLLAGWRSQLSELKKELPRAKNEPAQAGG